MAKKKIKGQQPEAKKQKELAEKHVGKDSNRQMYQGKLRAEAVSAVTGEKISLEWVEAMPMTEEGCWHTFNHHFGGMAIRDTFRLDPECKIDPGLRTSREITPNA